MALLSARDTRPCGGPSFDLIDQALKPVDEFIAWSSVQECDPEEADSSCAYIGNLSTVLELRFLHPFHLAKPDMYRELRNRSYFEYDYGTGASPKAEPKSSDALARKVDAGDWDGAESEARSLVERILDMPHFQADENRDVLARAVAALDLRPLAASVPDDALRAAWRGVLSSYRPAFLKAPPLASPIKEAREGTTRFIALKDAMRTRIPNGWREDIRKNVAPETWGALESLHAQWLKDFPGHPLADLARLSQVRLAYLRDRADESWKILFALYPKRPVRAVGEMRFLLQQEIAPDPAAVPDDPVLLSALAPWFEYQKDGAWSPLWTRLWDLSLADPKAPWATNLQIRLLKEAADQASPKSGLPEGFPAPAANPDPRWAAFRLFALYKVGRWDDALAQARLIKPNEITAAVIAKLHIRRKEWKEALGLKELPFDAKRYLIRVLLDDETLRSLQDLSDPRLKSEVRLTLAVRAAAKGDWPAGLALLADGDMRRAGLWEQAARLSADQTPSGRLALGRFLRKNDGKLFYAPDTVWYRSVFWRLSAVAGRGKENALPSNIDPGLPWTGEIESQAIRSHLTALEPFLALRAFATYLRETTGQGKQRKAALKEADQAYNWLLNWANNYSENWKSLLDQSDEAKIIRQAGLEVQKP
jgi:hypothetical protein